jgi:hypothetical protein
MPVTGSRDRIGKAQLECLGEEGARKSGFLRHLNLAHSPWLQIHLARKSKHPY